MSSFLIENQLSGHVIDIRGASATDGAALDAYHAKTVIKLKPSGGAGVENSANQLWEIVPDAGNPGYYFIKNPKTKHVIDIVDASSQDGAPLDAHDEKSDSGGDDASQLWRFLPDPAGSEYGYIQNKLTGHVLDIRHSSTADDADLDAFPQKLFDNGAQLWASAGGSFPTAKMVPVAKALESTFQYVLTGGAKQTHLTDIVVTIEIVTDLVIGPFSVQINGFSEKGDKAVDWQQYGFELRPGEKTLQLFAESYAANAAGGLGNSLYELFSPAMLTLDNETTIPAGHRIVTTLKTNSEDEIAEVEGRIYDSTGKQVGSTQKIKMVGEVGRSGKKVTDSEIAPVVAFQVVVVGYENDAHAEISSGLGTITCKCEQPLTAQEGWPGYSDGSFGTGETSNCRYGEIPAAPSHTLIQAFGVPTPRITEIVGFNGFIIIGGGFYPGDPLTTKYVAKSETGSHSTDTIKGFKAARDGSFEIVLDPVPGASAESPENQTEVDFTITDEHGEHATATCIVDQGVIVSVTLGPGGIN